jgi:endo-1,3-1,4-beta-glycanase ExoK
MIKNTFRAALGCAGISLIFLLSACGGGDLASTPATSSGFSSGSSARLSERSADRSKSAEISSLTLSTSASFSDELTFLDTSRWHAASWNNGGYFINGWHPDQLSFLNGRMDIKLQADTANLTGMPAVSGEYRTNNSYQYGLYKTRLIAAAMPGTISAFFTYAGPDTSSPHDEIDIEFKGDDLTKLQVNYWSNGVEHPTVISLGFNASAAYHDYAFHWTATGIHWYVDDVLVHSENGSRGPLPVTPGRIMLNHWGTVGTSPWSSDYVVPRTPSVMGVERVSFTSDTPAAAIPVVSVGALSGTAYLDGKGWRAAVSVTVRDASGAAVPGALVTGGFSAGGSPVSCTSAANGVCTITSTRINATIKSTTFSVSKITGTNMSYDPTKNATASVVMAKP